MSAGRVACSENSLVTQAVSLRQPELTVRVTKAFRRYQCRQAYRLSWDKNRYIRKVTIRFHSCKGNTDGKKHF